MGAVLFSEETQQAIYNLLEVHPSVPPMGNILQVYLRMQQDTNEFERAQKDSAALNQANEIARTMEVEIRVKAALRKERARVKRKNK